MLIQFEDFANHNAFRLLEKYRDRICTFNDDIQGTAAVALAGLFSALRITGGALPDRQRLLFLGAGEAATGIADLVVAGDDAPRAFRRAGRAACWLVDSKGAWSSPAAATWPRTSAVCPCARAGRRFRRRRSDALKPTAIIGVSGDGPVPSPKAIEAMARLNKRPIVFALSNPTSKSECTAEQAYQWRGGRALFASGSPLRPGDSRRSATTCRARATTPTSFRASASARSRCVRAASPMRCSSRPRALADRSDGGRSRAGQPVPAARGGARPVSAHRDGGRRGRVPRRACRGSRSRPTCTPMSGRGCTTPGIPAMPCAIAPEDPFGTVTHTNKPLR